jgi:hypothetical protein
MFWCLCKQTLDNSKGTIKNAIGKQTQTTQIRHERKHTHTHTSHAKHIYLKMCIYISLKVTYTLCCCFIHKSRGSKTSLTRHLIWSSCTKTEKCAVMYFCARVMIYAYFYHFFTFLFLYKTLFNCLHASDYLVQLFNWKQMNILSLQIWTKYTGIVIVFCQEKANPFTLWFFRLSEWGIVE